MRIVIQNIEKRFTHDGVIATDDVKKKIFYIAGSDDLIGLVEDAEELYEANRDLKIKLTETLQKHYDYANTQAQRNIDNVMVYASYNLLRDTVKIIAEELGVDLE